MRLSGCVYVGRTGIDSARNRYIRVHGFNALGGVVAILMFCVFACGSKGSCSEEVGVYRDSRHSLNVFGLFSPSLGKICSKNRESLNLPLATSTGVSRDCVTEDKNKIFKYSN